VGNRFLATHRGPPELYNLLGTACQMIGRLNRAEELFQEMVRQYPENSSSYYKLGLHYGYVKKYDAALRELKHALKISPDHPDILKALSVAYRQKGDINKAIETAEKIVQLQSQNPKETFYLAALYEAGARPQEAIRLYKMTLELDPRYVPALNNLAMQLSAAGNLSEARPYAMQACNLEPKNGTILDTCGWILYQMGEVKNASAWLQKAVDLTPSNPTLHYHFGMVLYKMHQPGEALKEFEKSLALSDHFPDRPLVLEMRKKLSLPPRKAPTN